MNLNKRIRDTIKKYGDEAPARFGVRKATLDGYLKRGKYPVAFIEKILADQMNSGNPELIAGEQMLGQGNYSTDEGLSQYSMIGEPEPPPQPEPAPPPPPQNAMTYGSLVQPHVALADATAKRVEEIVKYIQGTIDIYIRNFAHRISLLEKQADQIRAAQMRAAIGISSLARPDQNAPVQQTFTTNPLGNSLDSGIAPTKEMVDAQANMAIIEGVPVPGAQLARPAEFMPNQPAFGFGWNKPRPSR